mgnify:CR=1 FL=1
MKIKFLIILSYLLYGILIYSISSCLSSCKSWQVIQELDINTYHIYNPKKKSAEVISTKKKLEIGKIYRKSNLEIINLDEVNPVIE